MLLNQVQIPCPSLSELSNTSEHHPHPHGTAIPAHMDRIVSDFQGRQATNPHTTASREEWVPKWEAPYRCIPNGCIEAYHLFIYHHFPRTTGQGLAERLTAPTTRNSSGFSEGAVTDWLRGPLQSRVWRLASYNMGEANWQGLRRSQFRSRTLGQGQSPAGG